MCITGCRCLTIESTSTQLYGRNARPRNKPAQGSNVPAPTGSKFQVAIQTREAAKGAVAILQSLSLEDVSTADQGKRIVGLWSPESLDVPLGDREIVSLSRFRSTDAHCAIVYDQCLIRTTVPCLHTKALSARHAIDTFACRRIDTAATARQANWFASCHTPQCLSDARESLQIDSACHLIVNMHALHSIKVQIDEKSGQLKINPTEATSYHVSSKILQAAQELNSSRNDYSNYFVKLRSLVRLVIKKHDQGLIISCRW